MNRMFALTILLTVACGGAVAAFRAAGRSMGSTQSEAARSLASDASLGPEGWCWQAICPGRTTFGDAIIALDKLQNGLTGTVYHPRFLDYYWVSSDESWYVALITQNKVDQTYSVKMSLTKERQLHLSEVINLFGNPDAIQLCSAASNDGNGRVVEGRIFFENGVEILVSQLVPSGENRPTPDFVVIGITFNPPELGPQAGYIGAVPWHGFTMYAPRCT